MALIEYRIEYWNSTICKYVVGWMGNSLDMAEKMMFKPYNRRHTRRLIKITKEILYTEKEKK